VKFSSVTASTAVSGFVSPVVPSCCQNPLLQALTPDPGLKLYFATAAPHRLEVEPLVLVALVCGGLESLLELVQALNDFGDVDHENFSDRSALFCQPETITPIVL
jgi:hypothetical protein